MPDPSDPYAASVASLHAAETAPVDQGDRTAIANALGGVGSAFSELNQETQKNYENDIYNMQMAGRTEPIGAFVLPQGTSPADFAELRSSLDRFAADAGFRYFPTGDQITKMLKGRVWLQGDTGVFKWLSNVEGLNKMMPWLMTGQSAEQYHSSIDYVKDHIASYTGDPEMFPELAQEALSHGSSATTWLHTQLTYNKKYTQNAKTPWLEYGKNYSEWQDYKLSNKALAQQRFGNNATDAQFAQMMGENAPHRADVGSAMSLPGGGHVSVSTGAQPSAR